MNQSNGFNIALNEMSSQHTGVGQSFPSQSSSRVNIDDESAWQTPRRTSTFSSSSKPLLNRSESISIRKPVGGYPRLARHIGEHPEHAIFRRFASLNARNLLYLQAEIVFLEHRLDEIERENATHDIHFSAQILFDEDQRPQDTNASDQYQIIIALRDKLEQYNKMLLDHTQLHELPSPRPSDVYDLARFIGLEEHSHPTKRWPFEPEHTVWDFYFDKSSGRYDLNRPVEQDLVSLHGHKKGHEPEPFKRFVRWAILPPLLTLWSKRKTPSPDGSGISINGKTIDRLVHIFAIVVFSLLPTASIFALYFIPSTIWRLGFIALWSVIFNIALAFFTNASSEQAMAVSVAMASVQVVFVGTTSSSVS